MAVTPSLLKLLTTHRHQLRKREIPKALVSLLELTPTQILEDIINFWYFAHYRKPVWRRMHYEKYGRLIKKMCPLTSDPDKFWKMINPLLKRCTGKNA